MYAVISKRGYFTEDFLVFCLLGSFYPLFHDVSWATVTKYIPFMIIVTREAMNMAGQ